MKRTITRLVALVMIISMLAGFSLPARATELKTGIGVVTASSLRLRAAASTDSEILATAKRGDCVVIIREEGDWYLVNFNLKQGYMHKDYLEFNDKKNVKIGYAMFDTVSNVRKGPGTDTAIVAQAPKGETCFIIGFNCGWYKVSFNGQIGYVRSDLVTMLEIPYSNAGSKGNTYKEGSTTTATTSSSSSSGSSSKSSSSSSSSSTSSGSSTANSSSSGGTSTGNSLGERVASYALQFKGYRYVYGGASPSGFDCSGMVYYIYKQFGYNVGRTSTAQLNNGYPHVSRGNLQPGDIVLFERTYTASCPATHSGIYIGNGQFIHAANSRNGVIITSLDNAYYSSRFLCGVRVG
jgi:cell wall-associated NlpC family hydrolase